MLSGIIIFILFLGPLVFFHELGHFLFAKLFGVRVEVFSLGFGPKLFKFKWRETEYAISLIPLGGYVKMYGDDPLEMEGIPAEMRKYSFSYKSKWSRFWIVFGGPLANFLLAYGIFFSLLLLGEKLPEIKFGIIPSDAKFYKMGIRTGDILKRVNGEEVYSPSDIALTRRSVVDTITVERKKEPIKLAIGLSTKDFFGQFVKYPPLFRKPIVVNKFGDHFVVSIHSDRVDLKRSLDLFVEDVGEKKVYLYKVKKNQKLSDLNDSDFKVPSLEITLNFSQTDEVCKKLVENGFHPIDVVIKSVNTKSPADFAGLKADDIIISIGELKLTSFEDLRAHLQRLKSEFVEIKFLRKGQERSAKLRPKTVKIEGKPTKIIGVYSSVEYVSLNFIKTKSKGFLGSLSLGFYKTWMSVVKTAEGFKKLITSEVSLKNIGGPIAIGKVASDSFHTSLSYFFQIMALISVNLGIINLFPIPVLDGGHIMFIMLEIVNRGPVSRKKMEIAQQLGLSLLLLLMLAALFNDFSRFF